MDRNYESEPYGEIERIIKENVKSTNLGKTDSCMIGMMLDKYNLTNKSLLKEIISQLSQFKQIIIKNYKEVGLSKYMMDILFELYLSVKQSKQHILVSINQMRDMLQSNKELIFPLVQKNKTLVQNIHRLITALVQININIKKSNHIHYDLFLLSYYLSDKVSSQKILNLMECVSKTLHDVELNYNKDNHDVNQIIKDNIAFKKYKSMFKYDEIYQKQYLTNNNPMIQVQKNKEINKIQPKINEIKKKDDLYNIVDKENQIRLGNKQQQEVVNQQQQQGKERQFQQLNNEEIKDIYKVIIPDQLIKKQRVMSQDHYIQQKEQKQQQQVNQINQQKNDVKNKYQIIQIQQVQCDPQIQQLKQQQQQQQQQLLQKQQQQNNGKLQNQLPIGIKDQENKQRLQKNDNLSIIDLHYPKKLRNQINQPIIQQNQQVQSNQQPIILKEKQQVVLQKEQQQLKKDQNEQEQVFERKETEQQQENVQKYYNEEINTILTNIFELTGYERDYFMRLYGKFQYGLQDKFNKVQQDDLKKRYPEIDNLIKACKALEKTRKMIPRSVQIISCLMFLFKQNNKGRILQINTGEGKSITVGLMAATISLMKKSVDIYTSNKELAKRDCEEFEEFFHELGLTCGSIGQEEIRSSEPNETYKKDIVYGDVGSYAADLLGDYYEQRGTRCGRAFHYAIVDEVDCMFIDQHNHSTSLAKSIPGLCKLNIILWIIWYKISQLNDHFLNGYYYFVEKTEQKYSCKADEFIYEYIKNILSCDDEDSCEKENEKNNIINKVKINNNKEKYEQSKEIIEEISKQIPLHMKRFAMSQMKEWIKNAFYASELQRNKQYKIDNDKIVPIDYDNTGLAQNNTQWRGGLHQFIQMKENVTVTPMNMTVNFVSNIYMFLLYKSNLVGLTGTLGTSKSIHILEEFYSIDALKVPPFKPRKLTILQPIIERTTNDFSKCMMSQIQQKQNENRPCLIICEYEKFGKNLSKLIQKKFNNDLRIIEYYSGDESIEKESIDQFCVIISTNLAGRGTDIKLSQNIIQKGGLHVIVTFTPKNKRVEDQAFGRAGRCGQDGSAQMIIDGSKDSFITKNKITANNNLIEERDKIDSQMCERQLQNMKDISKMDEIFWDYCKTLNTCQELKDKQYMRKQEEEIWATFYCKIQFLRKEPEKVKQEYKQFKEEFEKRIKEQKIINPSYLINEGMKLLMDSKYPEAVKISEEIISKSQINNHLLPGYYIKAIALVCLRKHQKSIEALEQCENIILQRNHLHQSLQILQLQSQSLIQQEYNQELLEQSIILSQHFRNELQSSKIFNKQQKYNKSQLLDYITSSGSFKRIKDEEVIRGKILHQIRDLKDDVKILMRNPYQKEKLSFIQMNDYFQDEKITEQILREYSNEELPFVVEIIERQPLQWKSLIPLACGIFQLANSLYLLQVYQNPIQLELIEKQQIIHNNQSFITPTPSTNCSNQSLNNNGVLSKFPSASYSDDNQDNNNNVQKYSQMIEEQDKQIEGIAISIQRIVAVEGLDLKGCLSKKSLKLIEEIGRLNINDYSHILRIVNEQQGDKVQMELMQEIQFKNALTKEMAKYSPEIAFITQQMAKDGKFEKLRELARKFQQNCKKILETSSEQGQQGQQSSSIQELIPVVENNKVENIFKSFKNQFYYLNFNCFAKDILHSILSHICTNQKKIIIDNLENFIQENFELSFSSNQFIDIVFNLISQPISQSIDAICQNNNNNNNKINNNEQSPQQTMENIIINSIKQQILQNIKQLIKNIKSQISELIINHKKQQQQPQQQGYGHIQQKQILHLENKLKNHQKFYQYLKTDNILITELMSNLKQALIKLKIIDINNNPKQYIVYPFSETQLKQEIKYITLKNNPKLEEYDEFIDLISINIFKMFEKNTPSSSFNIKEFQSALFKKIQIKLLTPVFKIVSHVFQEQIESNAIFGLFHHIIQ